MRMNSALSENEKFQAEKDYKRELELMERYSNGVRVLLNSYDGLEKEYQSGNFIMAYFPAERKAKFIQPKGVEDVKLAEAYSIDKDAGNVLLKYMVHLKTQQAYVRNEGDEVIAQKIQQWFERFESALCILLDEESIHLEYDYRKYDFKIKQDGREPFTFNELSDGYSSVIYIISSISAFKSLSSARSKISAVF